MNCTDSLHAATMTGVPVGRPFIVTLDGPAGVGKSTIAKRVAEALGVAYLDTGAMFRTVALQLARNGALGTEMDFDAAAVRDTVLQKMLAGCDFSLDGAGSATRLLCNGVLVGDEIRTEEAGMMAARAAKLPLVREHLKVIQQTLGERFSLVAEGRDMGTVIFPGAQCKLFLDAKAEVRAERRFLQLRAMGLEADLEGLVEQIQKRDEQDRNRAIAPLIPADDARCIDTSHLDADQVFEEVLRHVREARDAECGPPDHPIRRKDRALEREETMQLLERGEYGILSLTDATGWPYAVPLSYVLLDGYIYFHSAYAGHKMEALAAGKRASFVVVGETQPVYVKDFSTYYESAMVFGLISLVDDEGEKRRSLLALARKYLPEHMDKADSSIDHSFSRTAVLRLSLDRVSGKAKRPK